MPERLEIFTNLDRLPTLRGSGHVTDTTAWYGQEGEVSFVATKNWLHGKKRDQRVIAIALKSTNQGVMTEVIGHFSTAFQDKPINHFNRKEGSIVIWDAAAVDHRRCNGNE